MKKLLTFATMFLIMFVSSCSYDDTGIWNSINNLEQRVLELEKTCKEINSNISAMQAILTALQNNDYVTSVVQVTENGKTIGYTINFSKSGPVTIYHGENGKDDANGADGKDGYTPVIGVRQGNDGIYYWTLDGEWLIDSDGNKIKAIGTDGKDGVNGTDGKDGADGITPQLKIEDDYWYISYDNGTTWTKLYKATGEDGKDGVNGNDGKDGVDGDSFFSSVTFDDEYIYLTLSDGTEIVVPMVDDSPLADLKSVVFIPQYSDGKATISFYNGDAVVEFDFMVAPASLASIIAENYESMLSISAIQTETRASTLIDLPVISCTADENGIISFKASCKQLDLVTKHYAVITISDGKNSITSESVEMIVSDKQDYMVETDYFKIEVTDIDTISAAIKVSSYLKTTFVATVIEYNGTATANDLMNKFVAQNGGYLNQGYMLYSGVYDWSGGPDSYGKYKLYTPNSEYAVIVFGYTPYVGITTEPVMVVFHILPSIGASETEFNMTASAITPYGFDINITSTEPSTYYLPGVCPQSEWDETKVVEEINAALLEGWEYWKHVNGDNLGEYLSYSCYRGDYELTASGLEPELEFMGYVLAIDYKTGKVVKTHTFNPLATTTKVGDITPTIEFVGYYSGNEEDGTIFGDVYATINKAIVAVKYTNIEGASSLFSYMMSDDMTDYTDTDIFSYSYGCWFKTELTQPYSFYLSEWNNESTVVAYAVDSNGHPGGVGRLLVEPTVDSTSDIEELRQLVDKVNAAQKSSFSVPTSIVVSEDIKLAKIN